MADGIVRTLTAEPIHQRDKIAVLRLLPVFLLEQLLQDFLAHQLGFILVQDPEPRIDRDHLIVPADHFKTEGVKRRDGSTPEQGQLPPEVGILRILLQLPVQRVADALTHLGRSRLSERGDKQPVHAEALLLIQNFPDDPFDQYGRFP